jgi:O-antigen ligase
MNTNKTLRSLILTGLFLIPFVPFIISGSMLFPFITGKNFAFRIIVEIIFALWLFLAIRDKEYRPKKSWILGAIWIFVAVIALADVFGENPLKSIWSNFERMEGLLSLVHFALYFTVLTSVFHTQKLWDWFWATWVGSAIIMCVYALFQLGGVITINQGGVRVDGTFGNAIYLAVFLVFTIFFSTFLFLRSKNKKNHLWYFVPVVLLQSFVLYHTATRGAVLGLLGGIIVTVVLTVLFDKASTDKKLRKTSLAVLAGVALLGLGFFAIRNTSFVKTSPVLARFASLSISEVKTQGRYFIWPMAIKGSLERPVLGWGQENFNYIFNKDYDPRMYNQELWFDRAHSAPLDWLVAGGILGFVSYLSLFFFALWYLWKDRHDAFSFLEKSIVTGLIAGYAFQAIFVFDNLVSYILFFSVLAFIASKTSGAHIRFPESLEKKSARPVISAILTILCVFSLYYFNVRPIETAQTLIDALRAGGAKDYKTALDDFTRALSIGYAGQAEIREQLASSASRRP